jgi:hypothetical protein
LKCESSNDAFRIEIIHVSICNYGRGFMNNMKVAVLTLSVLVAPMRAWSPSMPVLSVPECTMHNMAKATAVAGVAAVVYIAYKKGLIGKAIYSIVDTVATYPKTTVALVVSAAAIALAYRAGIFNNALATFVSIKSNTTLQPTAQGGVEIKANSGSTVQENNGGVKVEVDTTTDKSSTEGSSDQLTERQRLRNLDLAKKASTREGNNSSDSSSVDPVATTPSSKQKIDVAVDVQNVDQVPAATPEKTTVVVSVPEETGETAAPSLVEKQVVASSGAQTVNAKTTLPYNDLPTFID